MKILKSDLNNFDDSIINEAIEVMAQGGVILYPTDTVYGLGGNIFNRSAVKRIFNIKKRNLFKPLSILLSNKKAISHVAEVNLKDKPYIHRYLPGPYTLILNKKPIVLSTITGGRQSVGVRIPDCEIAQKLASIFPIITTSANISNQETLNTPKKILNQLDEEIDLIIDVGSLKNNNPSTIINLTSFNPNFLKR